MSLILVIDDMAVIREPIAASLRAAGHQTLCAGDGHEALAALATARPDLVLLDLAMPGMDGMAVLRALRAQSATAKLPVILLTASTDKEYVVEAARLGVRDYVLKSRFSLPDLLARVEKYLANPPKASVPEPAVKRAGDLPAQKPAGPTGDAPAGPASKAAVAPPRASLTSAKGSRDIPRLLEREQCIKRAQQAMEARTLSGVVAQVMSLTASSRADLPQLTSLIARDPMLSARVLQAANSANYASIRGVVSTLPDAVRNIGCAAVRQIATALSVFDAMPPSAPDGFNPIHCWQHSFAVATLCQRLSPETDSGPAYLIGLCHDLGEILLHTHFGPEYRQILEVQKSTGQSRDELEKAMLGMSRVEMLQTILKRLGLPDAIREPIHEYHTRGITGRLNNPLARVLRLADLYANGLLLASSTDSPLMPLGRAECRAAVANENPDRPDGPVLRSEIFALTAMLARLSAKDEAALLSAGQPRAIRVWLARDPCLSSFDPFEAAIGSQAQVTVRDALPSAQDAAAHDGLVVLARGTSAGQFSGPQLSEAAQRLPCLWVVGRLDEGVPPITSIAPIVWPMPVSRLIDFVQGIPMRNAVAA
ncbi:MAG TPA: HDOD domain-containing protein [Tepidisphaeraceae bacterium]|nr:HDOD domain-containing protein [Tepidisphaeraceae bacterium]